MLGPIPFRGGDVELLLALLAVEVKDNANTVVDLLGEFSQLIGGGELRVALQFLQPLKLGVERLFGFGGTTAHLWMHDTFSSGDHAPNPLTSGYRAVIRCTQERIDPITLWVKNGRLLRGTTMNKAQPFTGDDYFLYYVQRLSQRDDVAGMPTVEEAKRGAINAALRGTEQELDIAFTTFKGVVLESPDLIDNDQVQVISDLRDRVQKIKGLAGVAAPSPPVPAAAAAGQPGGIAGDEAKEAEKAEEVEEVEEPEAATPVLPSREEILGVDWR